MLQLTHLLISINCLLEGLEMAAPLWSPALSEGNCSQVERVQRQVTRVICGQGPMDYQQRLDFLSLKTLKQRRFDITRGFAIKMSTDPKYSHLFPIKEGSVTRNKKPYIEPKCNTNRYKFSSIPSFIRICNIEAQNKA